MESQFSIYIKSLSGLALKITVKGKTMVSYGFNIVRCQILRIWLKKKNTKISILLNLN